MAATEATETSKDSDNARIVGAKFVCLFQNDENGLVPHDFDCMLLWNCAHCGTICPYVACEKCGLSSCQSCSPADCCFCATASGDSEDHDQQEHQEPQEEENHPEQAADSGDTGATEDEAPLPSLYDKVVFSVQYIIFSTALRPTCPLL